MRESGSAALRLAIALMVIGAGYLGAAWFLGRHLPANTSVAGVPVGGMSPASAESTLRRALVSKERAALVVQAGDRTERLDPRVAGLSLDYGATVAGLSGFELAPRALWDHLTGGGDEPLRTRVDEPRLEAALADLKARFDRPVVQGGITFSAGRVAVVKPVAGATLSVSETAHEVAQRWPAQGAVAAKTTVAEPAVSAEEVDRGNREFAAPAMSGPVKVVAGSKSFSVPPAAYSPALAMKPGADGGLAPVVDNAKLVAVVRAAAVSAGLEVKPRDARITFTGTTPVVVPAVTGTALDDASVVSAFVPALTAPDRTAAVKAVVVQPKLTTAQAERIKPKEVISTFTTYFPHNPPRTNNITIAARTLNGTYVGPGEQFSLNRTLGERTAAKGYASAPVIEDGRLKKDYGGGVSQVSTTTFNAAFFAGVHIDQYLPHSFYISRYPEGREATVSWPDVDQRWTNDTGYGILIQAGVSGNAITVTFHGTKVWDIESVKGPRRNVVPPRTIVDNRPTCVPQTPSPGFDVTVSRIFKKGGKTVKTSSFTTHYIPEDNVRCTHPKAG
ncbi:VanW family protein [Pedococcus sp. 5OH_020]|uniref:VanW family protein n=1 Tax=Pedococcus sp. 5OH_020 TaxID=2989814 RepID=UPI0022E9A946|nr:VanW family protein [Pedococcus sp. 5OH_020]